MITFTTPHQWGDLRETLQPGSIGLVPTMGALHPGHMSLVQKSLEQNKATIVSIFVNPTQFNRAADLDNYPRQFEQDLALLEDIDVDGVFMPDYELLYPDDFSYRISESSLSDQLCGKHRPGHFDGVLTIVIKLLNIIRPDKAYFGEKDYQQLQLISGMVEAFFMPVEIIACPIIREADGLAMSSRNQLLDSEQRETAGMLFRNLSTSRDKSQARKQLEKNGFIVDYVEDLNGRRLAAASLGTTRLIDNVPIE
jgi:pantoate--beta-alanine ligase